MNDISDIHYRLTSDINISDSKRLALEFAKELGWNPSYFIEPSLIERSNGYLVVEHAADIKQSCAEILRRRISGSSDKESRNSQNYELCRRHVLLKLGN